SAPPCLHDQVPRPLLIPDPTLVVSRPPLDPQPGRPEPPPDLGGRPGPGLERGGPDFGAVEAVGVAGPAAVRARVAAPVLADPQLPTGAVGDAALVGAPVARPGGQLGPGEPE